MRQVYQYTFDQPESGLFRVLAVPLGGKFLLGRFNTGTSKFELFFDIDPAAANQPRLVGHTNATDSWDNHDGAGDVLLERSVVCLDTGEDKLLFEITIPSVNLEELLVGEGSALMESSGLSHDLIVAVQTTGAWIAHD